MSRVNSKPCCKVCKDAGKSAQEYSSHWPKNNTGRVVCPTLLEQRCRNCDAFGHTVKYCQELAKDKKNDAKFAHFVARQERIRSYDKKEKKPCASVAPTVSRFALLMEDNESDESPRSPKRTEKKAPVEEFPALPGNVAIWPEHAPAPLRGKPMAWSDMITMARGVMDGYVTPEMSGLFDLKREPKEMSAREKAAAIHRQECFKGLNGKGWADLDDSDDEELEMTAEDAW
jgi:hypothetical protein